MASLLYMTDGHHGPYIPSSSESGYALRGEDAPVTRLAIQAYAKDRNIPTILDGGDQNTFQELSEDFSEYRASTQRICQEFNGLYITANGNHDFDKANKKFHITRQSKLILPQGFNDTTVLALQPKSGEGKSGLRYYYYDEAELLALLDQVETTNLIVLSHWRLPLEKPTQSIPNKRKPRLKDAFSQDTAEQIAAIAQKHNILGLHGHSHYFEMNDDIFPTLTMPSFIQSQQEESMPCGLFAQINEENGELQIQYKKIAFDPTTFGIVSPPRYNVIDVDEDHMNQYGPREYVEPKIKPLDWQQQLGGLPR